MKFFLSERISQDPLENFFGCQRQRGRTGENPNAHQYCKNTQALRVINSDCADVPKGNCRGRKQHIDMQDKKPLPKRHRIRKQASDNDKKITDVEKIDVVLSSAQIIAFPLPHMSIHTASVSPPAEAVISPSSEAAISSLGQTVTSPVKPSKLSPTAVHTQCPLSVNEPDLSLQFVSTQETNLLPMNTVLKQLNVIRHLIDGDGSCLYHAVAHQAGFIPKSSRGDRVTSSLLRQMVSKTMDECPHVRMEDGLSLVHWLEKKQAVLDPSEWGGDLELRLLAIGLKRDIVVITSVDNGEHSYARRFLCEPKPSQKMRGGIFIPLSCNELCGWWQHVIPSPLLVIFNGYNHYDSTLSLSTS